MLETSYALLLNDFEKESKSDEHIIKNQMTTGFAPQSGENFETWRKIY
jgi:hypothetical protein